MREVLDLKKFGKVKGGKHELNIFGLLVLSTKRGNIAAEKNTNITS
jgi:hypothetical protein